MKDTNEILSPLVLSSDNINLESADSIISIEILNDEVTGDDFDKFIDYCVEAESNERSTLFSGHFSGDFLVLNIGEERFNFINSLDTDTLESVSVYTAFNKHVSEFIEWYRCKVSEFFVIEKVDLSLEFV